MTEPDEQTDPQDADVPEHQRLILEDSERREADRDAAPGSVVEHRTSDEATPPT